MIWTRARSVDFSNADNLGELPIEFKPGSLGPKLPRRPLVVSPQHRVLMRTGQGEEILAPAKALVNRALVRRKAGKKSIAYHHLLLDHHGIVFAEGAAAETLYASDTLLRQVGGRDRARILAHYPIAGPMPELARRVMKTREVMAARELWLRPWGWVKQLMSA